MKYEIVRTEFDAVSRVAELRRQGFTAYFIALNSRWFEIRYWSSEEDRENLDEKGN